MKTRWLFSQLQRRKSRPPRRSRRIEGGHPPKILNNAAFTVNVTTPIHTHSKATSPARILPAVPVDMNFDRVRIEHFLLPSKSVSGDRNV
jgi:hypothetical protein